MSAPPGNLLNDLPRGSPGEVFQEILSCPGLKIERIVSTGHVSPPGFWYDAPHDEWVAVLIGSAELTIEGEESARRLGPGDHIFLPAHCRHRVERTADPTVWLAVHIDQSDR